MIKEIISEPTISFLGNKGRGKTIGASILANNINDDCIIFDIVGAFTKDRLIKKAVYIEIDERKFSKKQLMPIFQKFRKTNKIVLNLQRLTSKEIIDFSEIMCSLILEIGDVALVVDEVGELVSQNKEKYSPEYERLVRIGRNYNIRPLIQITQRPQKVDKNVLALTDYYCVMGLSHNLDLNAVQDLIGMDKNEFLQIRQDVKMQEVGDCLLIKHNGEIKATHFNMNNDTLDIRKKAVVEVETIKPLKKDLEKHEVIARFEANKRNNQEEL